MSKLQIIIGVTRSGRAAGLVGPWVTDRARGQLPPAAFRIREAAAAVDEVEDEAV
jgi:hypothetical protein